MKTAAQACPLWYIGLRAVDEFHLKHGRYPGVTDDQVIGDAAVLHEVGAEIASVFGFEKDIFTEGHAKEFARYGGSVMHPIAAFVGGECRDI